EAALGADLQDAAGGTSELGAERIIRGEQPRPEVDADRVVAAEGPFHRIRLEPATRTIEHPVRHQPVRAALLPHPDGAVERALPWPRRISGGEPTQQLRRHVAGI